MMEQKMKEEQERRKIKSGTEQDHMDLLERTVNGYVSFLCLLKEITTNRHVKNENKTKHQEFIL